MKNLRGGIRRKLIVTFGLVGLLPIIVIGLLAFQVSSNALEDETGEKVEENAQLHMEKIDRFMYERIRDLNVLSQLDFVQNALTDELSITNDLDSAIQTHNYFESLTVLDSDGELRGQSSNQPGTNYEPSSSWFQDSIQGEVTLSDIQYDDALDEFVMMFYVPIEQGESINGIIEASLNMTHIWDDINSIMTDSSTVELVDQTGEKIADTVSQATVNESEETVSDQLDPQSNIYQIVNQLEQDQSGVTRAQSSADVDSIIGYARSGGYSDYSGNDWVLLVNEDRDEVLSSVVNLRTIILGVALLTMLIVSVTGYLVSRRITKPLMQLQQSAQLVSSGDLTIDIPIRGSGEVKQLSLAIQQMVQDLKSAMKKTNDTAGDLSHQSGDLKNSSEDLQEGIIQTSETLQELAQGAEKQASSAADVVNASQTLDLEIQALRNDSQALTDVSTSVNDLSSQGYEQMVQSLNQMRHVNEQVHTSVEKLNGLEARTEDVVRLTDVINQITEQTNLLALNAAIESKRAGEAGQGFTVVANEIRKLAEQVSRSAVDISNVIQSMKSETRTLADSLNQTATQSEKGVNEIERSNDYFDQIKSTIQKMDETITHVRKTVNTIDESSQHMHKEIQQIASISEESSASIEETAAYSQQQRDTIEQLSEQSVALDQLAETLKSSVNTFKL
ncbi:Methyl-accepting chemotaxis protein [Pelagirhabdus alkalitolerans]|uniref:Methyl-accepting chemotaxis protein n=1 Tax=Pelagirhabdus alkalitolerans TaxID=1612202 RepID=A0A1G6HDE7_9BACI|nr:methyl-accepting chemotaxis protein [Pelagirhabdus alkalitolerans]SDB91945.1 Methyl-accepting chemotaxis protein [Pelagirhabdus alkalitolerans]